MLQFAVAVITIDCNENNDKKIQKYNNIIKQEYNINNSGRHIAHSVMTVALKDRGKRLG